MKTNHIIVITLILTLLISGQIIALGEAEENCCGQCCQGEIKVTQKEIKEENTELNYSIEAYYPELEDCTNEEVKKDFNDKILSSVNKSIEDFREAVKEFHSEMEESFNAYCIHNYSVTKGNDGIISIRFYIEEFAGGAHPSHTYSSLNYNLKTGSEIKLSDLFSEDSDYLTVISEYCIKDLKKQKTEAGDSGEGFIEDGAGPKEENFYCFNLTDQGLLITFNEYQVGPYAEGYKEVTIPYEDLKDVINPDGPAGI